MTARCCCSTSAWRRSPRRRPRPATPLRADTRPSASRPRHASEALLDGLGALAAPGQTATVPEGNPYRGLLPFEAGHRGLFFGRGPEIRSGTERLRSEPFVLIAGESGVGKSSLCRAGVL